MSVTSTFATTWCVLGGSGIGPMFAAQTQERHVHHRSYSHWRWHLDEVFVRTNSGNHYLWQPVVYEGEVLEAFVTKRGDRKAAANV